MGRELGGAGRLVALHLRPDARAHRRLVQLLLLKVKREAACGCPGTGITLLRKCATLQWRCISFPCIPAPEYLWYTGCVRQSLHVYLHPEYLQYMGCVCQNLHVKRVIASGSGKKSGK